MAYRKTGQWSRSSIPSRGAIYLPGGGTIFDREGGGSTALGEAIDFKSPEYDLGRINELTQEQLAPALSESRRNIQAVQAGRYANPIARREAVRGAIRGSGELISGAQATATKTATALYAPEYQAKMQEALLRYKKTLMDNETARKDAIRRGSDVSGGETYRQAAARLDAWDPYDEERTALPTVGSSSPGQDYSREFMAGTELGGYYS
jgi:hypothetical protein